MQDKRMWVGLPKEVQAQLEALEQEQVAKRAEEKEHAENGSQLEETAMDTAK